MANGEEIRGPAVAGTFYEETPDGLASQIEACYLDARGPGAVPAVNDDGPREIIGLVSPHAGYTFSGPTAAKGMAALAADGRPDVFVIIGPNHGRGHFVNAIQTGGSWATPLGESPIAEGVAKAIADSCPSLQDGAAGFEEEHSIEVQLPLLQHLYGTSVEFVPIMMLDQGIDAARELGEALAEAIRDVNAVIIASTDMTHLKPVMVAQEQDVLLIEHMIALDPEGMLRERHERNITMCGHGPTAAMLFAGLKLGAKQAQMIDYTNSGDIQGMGRGAQVVAYLSLVLS